MIYFKTNDYLVYERVKTEGQFCGNLSHGSNPKFIAKDSIEDKDIIQPNLINFKKIIEELNYPWLSIDLYVDDKDNIGIFEFQMEFGYEGFDYKHVKEKMIDNINFIINNK